MLLQVIDELQSLWLHLFLFQELLCSIVGRAVVNPRHSNEAFEFGAHQREGTGVAARIDEVENARGMFERQIIELSRNAMAVVAIDLHAGKLTVDPVERAANFCQSGPYVIRRHLRCHSSTNLPHVDRAQRAWSSSRHERRRSEEHTSELQSIMRISSSVFC